MTTSSIPSRRLNFALALLASALFVGLAYLMLLGAFSRYWSDDFCFLAASQTSPNLWAALQKIYLSWSNRYANMALIGLAQLFGRRVVTVFPAALMTLLTLSAFLALRQTARLMKITLRPLAALTLALALTFFSILQAPNRFQAVFWMTGLVTYFAPLIFWCLLIFLILRAKGWPAWLMIAALAFLAAGTSETTLVVQVTFLTLWLAFALWRRKNEPELPGLSLAWLFTLFGFLVVFLAPGNAVRISELPQAPPRSISLESILLIFRFAADFAFGQLRSFPLPAAFAFGVGLFVGLSGFSGAPKPSAAGFLLPAALTYLLLASLVTPSVYVYGRFGYPEARALFPGAALLTALILLEGVLLGWRLARIQAAHAALPLMLVALTLAAYPVWFIVRDARALPQVQRYARDWDLREAAIQQQRGQGNLTPVVKGIESPGGLGEIKPDPQFWINRCVADTYQLESIAIFP